MKRLGISIYPEIVGEQETIKYISLANKHGFKRVFANLLEVKDDAEGKEKLKMFKNVWMHANKLGFEVIVDVNPNVYKDLKLPNDELKFFKNLGATGIRLDEDFGGELEAKLSRNKLNMKIELNASAPPTTFNNALSLKANPDNLIGCHNFYPMRYTGLQYERFIELSSRLKAHNIKVAAFITLPEKQKGVGPWNVNEGMPTIEEHRDLSLLEQAEWFLKLGVVDDIIISQQGATSDQFKQLGKLIKEIEKIEKADVVKIKAKLIKPNKTDESILSFIKKFKFGGKTNSTHSNRADFNAYFVRSTLTRIVYKDEVVKPKNAGKKLKKGDIVIVNENLGRYKGEVHIILKDIDDSKQKSRNLIGRVDKEELFKIDHIKGGTKFKLMY